MHVCACAQNDRGAAVVNACCLNRQPAGQNPNGCRCLGWHNFDHVRVQTTDRPPAESRSDALAQDDWNGAEWCCTQASGRSAVQFWGRLAFPPSTPRALGYRVRGARRRNGRLLVLDPVSRWTSATSRLTGGAWPDDDGREGSSCLPASTGDSKRGVDRARLSLIGGGAKSVSAAARARGREMRGRTDGDTEIGTRAETDARRRNRVAGIAGRAKK